MPISLLLATLFPFLGVAAQAAGLYALAIVVPALLLFSRRAVPNHTASSLMRLGLAFLCVWAVFPLANILALALPVPDLVAGAFQRTLPERGAGALFASRLSSAWAVSGLALVAAGLAAKTRQARHLEVEEAQAALPIAFRWFLRGLLGFSALWICYLSLQHVTGFEPRNAARVLLPEHRMGNGAYRAFGLYGHPLSVAGTGLTFFSFFWFLCWARFEEASANADAARTSIETTAVRTVSAFGPAGSALAVFPKAAPWVSTAALATGAGAHFLAVVESGGRTALAAAALIGAIIPLSVRLRGRYASLRFAGAGAVLCVAVLGVLSTGLLSRVEEFFRHFQGGEAENRFHFWAVYARMIADAPWFGQGHWWIEHGLRDAYYDASGFASLNEKFNAHNIFLETLANVGVLGSVLVLAGVVFLFSRLGGLARSALGSEGRLIYRGLGFALVANLAHGLTQNTFFDSNVMLPYLFLFWVCVWMSVGMAPFAPLDVRLREDAATP